MPGRESAEEGMGYLVLMVPAFAVALLLSHLFDGSKSPIGRQLQPKPTIVAR